MQIWTENQTINAGDNVFVYCFVLLGYFSIPLFILGITMIMKMCRHLERADVRDVIVLAVIINWYGGVSNILEHAVLSFAMGILCRYLAMMFIGKIDNNPKNNPALMT